MDNWKECQLGDLIEIKYGKDHKKLDEGKYPCIGSGGIMRYVDSFLYDKESILIPRKGSLNNIMYRDKPFWTVDTMFWSKIIEESVLPKFLFYQLTLIDYTLLNVGSAVPSLTVPVISEIDVNLPPLPEQEAIAEVLSSLDDKIDLLHRQNKTLEALAQTLFRKWFVAEADERWEEVSLGKSDLCSLINSGINDFKEEKIYLATADVQGEKITNRDTKITFENRPSRANMQPVQNSVWFAKKGGSRKVLMFNDFNKYELGNFILSTGFSGLKTTELSHYYIWCFILSEDFQEIKDNLLSGSVQPDINNDGIKSIKILHPDNNTLENFNLKAKPIFNKVQHNNSQILTLKSIRDTLLPKLMSGAVRVRSEKLKGI